MKFEKGVAINIGNYQNLKLNVTDAPSFEEADKALIQEIQRLNIPVSDKIKQSLNWRSVDDWQ